MPQGLVSGHRLFVEDEMTFEPQPVGCAELRNLDPARTETLGAVLNGRAPGRRTAEEITVYKAMGLAMEDLVASEIVWQRAQADGAGSWAVI